MRMICFPHAGGFSQYYSFLKKGNYQRISEIELYEYPGRAYHDSDAIPECWNAFIEEITAHLQNTLTEKESYVLFGHSMGAFVAYETAVAMDKQYHHPPELVFLSGQRPPCTLEKGYFNSDPAVAVPFCKNLGGMENLLNADERVQNFFLPIMLHDIQLLETYQPTLPAKENRLPACVLMYGEEDVELKNRDMRLWLKHFIKIKGEFSFVGGHFYLDSCHEKIVRIIDEMTMI